MTQFKQLEIEEQAALWNSTLKEYSDKNVRKISGKKEKCIEC
jgi:hypothetical protein